ncbi:MAG: hypothetical protein ABIJ56_08360 [Pseudomonadota bacterium]
MRKPIYLLFIAVIVSAGCYRSGNMDSDVGEDGVQDTASEAGDAVQQDPLTEPDAVEDPAAEPELPETSCPERILPALCPALPPDCPEGYFPVSDGTCWTGACLHCIDGCLSDGECVALQVCGCGYHEGCGWAETTFRFELETDECIRPIDQACPGACHDSEECPPVCEEDPNGRCCGWCDPPDDTQCVDGACEEIINHMCE